MKCDAVRLNCIAQGLGYARATVMSSELFSNLRKTLLLTLDIGLHKLFSDKIFLGCILCRFAIS